MRDDKKRKKLLAAFYRTATGTEPGPCLAEVPDCRRSAHRRNRHRYRRVRVADRNAGLPHDDVAGLWEVRSSRTGNRIARVLFCVYKGQLILLHGFIKKTQQTSDADLDLAMRRKKEI